MDVTELVQRMISTEMLIPSATSHQFKIAFADLGELSNTGPRGLLIIDDSLVLDINKFTKMIKDKIDGVMDCKCLEEDAFCEYQKTYLPFIVVFNSQANFSNFQANLLQQLQNV